MRRFALETDWIFQGRSPYIFVAISNNIKKGR